MNASRLKSAIITGGSSGIGLATARALHDAGYAVTIVGRREDVLASAVESLVGSGSPAARYHVADVGSPDTAEAVVRGHVRAFDGLDALVTAAAVYEPTPLLELTAQNWDDTINVALRGSVLMAVEAARHMQEQGGGRLVFISSINGFHAEPESVHYGAAKAAIMNVVKSFAVDLASTGVIANAIAPGWVYTPMTADFIDSTTSEQMRRVNPLGRAGRTDEIAAVALFLVKDAPEFLVGSTIFVDGGQTAQAPMP